MSWLLIGLASLMGLVTTRDRWREIGQVVPGFALMETLQAGPGGAGRGAFETFDVVRAVNGTPVTSAAEVWAEAARHPPGTPLRYEVQRGSRTVEVTQPTRRITRRSFLSFLLEGIVPGALVLAVAAAVVSIRPGAAGTRPFLAFCLMVAGTGFGYFDLVTTHRFSRVTLALWSFTPAALIHLALVYPAPWDSVHRRRWLPALPWIAFVPLAAWVQWNFLRHDTPAGEVVAVAGVIALVILFGALVRTARRGATPLARQHARLLLAAFAVAYLLPFVGNACEVAFHVTVPGLRFLRDLRLLFPIAIAYAIVRYQLFDVRAAVRLGTIYSAVVALLAMIYALFLTGLNLMLAGLGLDASPLVPAAFGAVAVVVVVNPLYGWTRRIVDRVFFRARYDAQHAAERLADALTTVLDLDRISMLLSDTLGAVLHPSHTAVLAAEETDEFRALQGGLRRPVLGRESALARALARWRDPLTRDRLVGDPALAAERDDCLADLDRLDAELAAPILFRDRLNGVLVAGPRRGGAPYTADDVRLVRQVANQSAVALENARAYHALQAALRRVEILESIRANLAKFVPRTVQDLIERTPESPALEPRPADVSVLFVDIAGYTGLSERLDAARMTLLVERYFGAFLDEILARGGDVNETAGDGLMVIFRDEDPTRHARAAVETAQAILSRAVAINAEQAHRAEPIHLHVGLNSGVAAVGAVRLESAAGARWTYTASGPVTNVASRLAALSNDTIVLGPETARRLAGALALEPLGPCTLRNVAEPVEVFRLVPAAGANAGQSLSPPARRR